MVRNAIIVVLTLAAVGTCVAWPLSYWGVVGSSYRWWPDQESIWAHFHDGEARLALSLDSDAESASIGTNLHLLGAFGFTDEVMEVRYTDRTVYKRQRRVYAPVWAVALLFAAYPSIVLIRGIPTRRRRHREEHGLCLRCGYDLTGNASGVCPECGTEVKPR